MRNKSIAIIILPLMLMAQMGTDVYLASLPAISVSLSSAITTVQYTFSIFLAGFAVSQLFYGPLSDRYGRKPCVLFGLVLYSSMGLLCSFSTNALELLIARLAQGIGAGACTVVARAIMQDTFKGKDLDRINIYQSMVWSVVPISAPLLGSYIQHYLGWRYNFLLLTLVGVLLLIICLIKLPETNKNKEDMIHYLHVLKDYENILINRRFFPCLIFSGCIISLLAIFNVSAPVIIQTVFNQSPIVYGWSTFSVAITFTFGSMISHLLTSRLSPNHLMLIGWVVIACSGVALLFINALAQPNLYTFLIPIMLMQVGSAIAFPSAAATTMRPYTQKAGKAAAVFGCTLFAGSSFASTVISGLNITNLTSLSTFMLLFIAIMMPAYIMTRRHVHD